MEETKQQEEHYCDIFDLKVEFANNPDISELLNEILDSQDAKLKKIEDVVEEYIMEEFESIKLDIPSINYTIKDTNSNILIAYNRDNKEFCGYINYTDNGYYLYIDYIFTANFNVNKTSGKKNELMKGIGSLLLKKIIDMLTPKHVGILLQPLDSAIIFYEKKGFIKAPIEGGAMFLKNKDFNTEDHTKILDEFFCMYGFQDTPVVREYVEGFNREEWKNILKNSDSLGLFDFFDIFKKYLTGEEFTMLRDISAVMSSLITVGKNELAFEIYQYCEAYISVDLLFAILQSLITLEDDENSLVLHQIEQKILDTLIKREVDNANMKFGVIRSLKFYHEGIFNYTCKSRNMGVKKAAIMLHEKFKKKDSGKLKKKVNKSRKKSIKKVRKSSIKKVRKSSLKK